MALSSCLNARGPRATRVYRNRNMLLCISVFGEETRLLTLIGLLYLEDGVWNLFRNISNNLPINMTPICSAHFTIRPHRCQIIKFHLNISHVYSDFIFA
jgi:hypothetical protein